MKAISVSSYLSAANGTQRDELSRSSVVAKRARTSETPASEIRVELGAVPDVRFRFDVRIHRQLDALVDFAWGLASGRPMEATASREPIWPSSLIVERQSEQCKRRAQIAVD